MLCQSSKADMCIGSRPRRGIKEVKLLGEHGEEASQKIIELEALCKKLREDAQKLREEKAKLEEMVESRDELIMEFANMYGYNCSDEDDEDDDDGGDIATPPVVVPPLVPTPAATPEGSSSKRKALWRWFPSMRPLKHVMLSW
jgi:hypothetical protein